MPLTDRRPHPLQSRRQSRPPTRARQRKRHQSRLIVPPRQKPHRMQRHRHQIIRLPQDLSPGPHHPRHKRPNRMSLVTMLEPQNHIPAPAIVNQRRPRPPVNRFLLQTPCTEPFRAHLKIKRHPAARTKRRRNKIQRRPPLRRNHSLPVHHLPRNHTTRRQNSIHRISRKVRNLPIKTNHHPPKMIFDFA